MVAADIIVMTVETMVPWDQSPADLLSMAPDHDTRQRPQRVAQAAGDLVVRDLRPEMP
jgi:hypothetical protein